MVIKANDVNGKTLARYINGKEIPNWQRAADIYDYLNVLGEQGWELVAAPYTEVGFFIWDEWVWGGEHLFAGNGTSVKSAHAERDTTVRFVFKRPKP